MGIFKSAKKALKFKKTHNVIIGVIILALLLYLLSIVTIINSSKNITSYINEAGRYNTKIIEDKIKDNFRYLESAGTLAIDLPQSHQKDECIFAIEEKMTFFEMTVADMAGSCTLGDENANISAEDYFRMAFSGEKSVSYVSHAVGDRDAIVFAAPIILNGKTESVAIGYMDISAFESLINVSDYTNTDEAFLINPSGLLVADNTKNFFEDIMKDNPSVKKRISDIQNNIYEGQETSIIYKQNGEEIAVHLSPFGYNNWVIASTQQSAELIENRGQFIAINILIIILFTLAFIGVIIIRIRAKRRFKEASDVHKTISNLIYNSSETNIFEYDFETEHVKFTSHGCRQFDIKEGLIPVTELLRDSDTIFKSHRELLLDFYDRVRSGIRYNEAFCKLKPQSQEQYFLYRVSSTTIYNSKGKPITTVGFIDKMSKENEESEDIVVHDTLTGLFNRVALKNMLNSYTMYSNNEQGAYILVDINNFKQINEKLGYREGDFIIKNIADRLRMLFRSSDIIARTNDDEFSIFMKNVSSEELVQKRVVSILVALENVLPKDKKFKCSANIGIALYPEDASDFNKLYSNAKIALNEAKETSKVYCYYSEASVD